MYPKNDLADLNMHKAQWKKRWTTTRFGCCVKLLDYFLYVACSLLDILLDFPSLSLLPSKEGKV